MTGLEARGQALGEAARRRATGRLAGQLRALPGIAVEVSEAGLVVSGRGVLRDPRLVWIGSWFR